MCGLSQLRRGVVWWLVGAAIVGGFSSPLWAERDREAAWRERAIAVRDSLEALDNDALRFHQIVTTLSDPFFEGRSPDTRGNWFAAEYVRFAFERAGLLPAFASSEGAGIDSWFQSFEVPGEVEITHALCAAAVANGAITFAHEKEFNPLGFSGNGDVTGPLSFVGYSIAGGPEGYTSFAPHDDLTGRIAVMFRFEPVNDAGKSRWTTFEGWSRHAALMEKVGEAVTRGAIGVVLVNPPEIDDPRAKKLETTASTRIGKPAGVPVVMLSNDAAEKLLAHAVTEELARERGLGAPSLRSLRDLADKGGHGAIKLSDDVALKIGVGMERAKMPTRNVGGVIAGRGSLAEEYVIIGAHYDHVGYGYVGGSNPSNQGKLHPGADDNASGVAGLLMLGERLKEHYEQMPVGDSARSVMLLAFSAEEMGLLGAEHYVKSAHLDAAKIEAMINLDMIGRVQGNRVEVAGMGTADEMKQVLGPVFGASGLDIKESDSGMGPSDHAAFHRVGVPVLHFFSGVHPDYHTPTDLAHKINFEGGVRVVELIEDVALVLARRSGDLTAKQTSGPQMPRGRAKVRLGIMPGDYSGAEPGVLVGDVYEGTSAANAGIIKGDRLIRWGGEELADAGVMMQRLVDAKPGDVVEVVVVREGKEVTMPVTLLAKPDGQ